MSVNITAITIACGTICAATASAGPSQTASADEVRAMVAEMVADAETRSSLLQAGGAGYDGRFYLASPDGEFRLNVGGQAQFRYTLNFRNDDGGATDDFEPGFSTPRTAIRFDGHVHDPSLTYAIQANFDRDGGEFNLEDAYVGYTFENGLTVLGGQFRLPILWEDVIFETKSLAVTESVVNAVFSQGRSQALAIHYAAETWRVWAAFSDGIRSANSEFGTEGADFGVTARLEFMFDGDWSQFNAFSSPRGAELFSKLGVGGHYELSANRPGADDVDTIAYTADYMTGGDGWNAYIAGVGLYTDSAMVGSFQDFGAIAQGGYFVTEDLEPFLRWDAIFPDSDRAGDDDFHTVTLGANYYLYGHAAKFTFDVAWFLNDPASNDLVNNVTAGPLGGRGRSLGLLPSAEDDQVALRAQFQLLF